MLGALRGEPARVVLRRLVLCRLLDVARIVRTVTTSERLRVVVAWARTAMAEWLCRATELEAAQHAPLGTGFVMQRRGSEALMGARVCPWDGEDGPRDGG